MSKAAENSIRRRPKTLVQKEDKRARGKLANILRAARKEKKMSIDDVARQAHISRSYLGDLEAGRKGSNMSMFTANRLARVLELSPHVLCVREDVKSSQTDMRMYGEHYRSLRSNVRAHQVAVLLHRIRTDVAAVRAANMQGKDASNMLQDIETAVEAIDDALAYRKHAPVKVRPADETGDDDKFFEFGKSTG